ncbi:hypothetical protein [Flavobacterium sp.]
MAIKTIKLKVKSNQIIIPIDKRYIGKYVKITITSDEPLTVITDASDRKKLIVSSVDFKRKENESVLDELPKWNIARKAVKTSKSTVVTNIKESIPTSFMFSDRKSNRNISVDENFFDENPSWLKDTPLDKSIDILGYTEKIE